MAGSEIPQNSAATPSRRNQQHRRQPRLRLACLRCQRRKIRCDDQLPACKNCQNARVSCADGESARLRELPRAYIVGLKDRISWLESIVRARCPDVDLSQGPVAEEGNEEGGSPMNQSPRNLSQGPVAEEGDEEGGNLHQPPGTPDNAQATPSTARIPGPVTHGESSAHQTQHHGSRPSVNQPVGATNALSHEIGLVSLGTNLDPRYIGPSSGYFLARVMLTNTPRQHSRQSSSSRETAIPSELVEAVQGPLPLPQKDMAMQLCDAYFEIIHPQYPALHRPTFMNILNQIYDQDDPDPVLAFQIYMVLAIGSTVLSGRLRTRLPGESYCLSALQFFHRLNIENSLQGLQCLILLALFTIHSPSTRLNIWYLNYQCIAGVLDLGLQRDITTRSGISLLEQEMRTRIFWVVFTLDRTIATMMGRPIGLRDEACELRLPQGLDDSVLSTSGLSQTMPGKAGFTPMSYSVHLFRLAKLNSEIKYVANSIVRQAPSYAYPAVINIHEWQSGVLQQLDQWAADIPAGGDSPSAFHMNLLSRLRYHSLRMVLLRPSPAIPKPSTEALQKCHFSACEAIRIFDKLYRENFLVHSWVTFHALVLSALTMLYCIKMVPKIAQETDVQALMSDLSISSSILSATGEHWSGAKRCRDILDDLGRSAIQQLFGSASRQPVHTDAHRRRSQRVVTTDQASSATLDPNMSVASLGEENAISPALANFQFIGQEAYEVPLNLFDDFLATGPFGDYFEGNDASNMDNIVQNLLNEFNATAPASGDGLAFVPDLLVRDLPS